MFKLKKKNKDAKLRTAPLMADTCSSGLYLLEFNLQYIKDALTQDGAG